MAEGEGQDTPAERLSSLENKLAGVIQGQNAMRDHVDHGFNEIKTLISQRSENQPLRVVEWTLIVLAATNVMLVVTGGFVIWEYLTKG